MTAVHQVERVAGRQPTDTQGIEQAQLRRTAPVYGME
jgi:hypothetical protein